ncbi:MAG: dihydrodipicolinate synthase family protein, partial [Bacteriovoracaceae bacterium]
FWAIKEASGSVEKMKEYLAAAGGKRVYCGDDALMPEFSAAGAVGLVSVASNAWPTETNLYVRKCLDKTLEEKQMWADASNSLFIASNPVPVKRLMSERGDISTPRMVAPLSDKDLASAEVLLTHDKNVKLWYGEHK